MQQGPTSFYTLLMVRREARGPPWNDACSPCVGWSAMGCA